MSKINKKSMVMDHRINHSERLAGGLGAPAAKQNAEKQLRRAVMACLLWENVAYESGKAGGDNIAELIPQVAPKTVAEIAIAARTEQKLRHVPLFIVSEMAKHPEHRKLVADTLPQVITRVDQITDFMAIYWKNGKCPIANSIKKGLAKCFNKFKEYHFAKYNRDTPIKFRDVLFMVHPKPVSADQQELFNKIVNNTLSTPDTWEVALSSGENKKDVFTRLIEEGKLGGLAFIRNLRNMVESKVPYETVAKGFKNLSKAAVLPLNFFAAAKHAPTYLREIENAMLDTYSNIPSLPGHTVLVVDVSGSMGAMISGKSEFNRVDAATAMAILAAETCERITIYATAGSDGAYKHKTMKLAPYRGFALQKEIQKAKGALGGGGIFTRQCLEFIKDDLDSKPDRIIIFSDSQDCDRDKSVPPKPFGKTNYIVDVSSHKNGINYAGVFDAEISGWSENFLTYVRASEGVNNSFEDEPEQLN